MRKSKRDLTRRDLLQRSLGSVETGDNGGFEVKPDSLKQELKELGARPAAGLDVSAHACDFFDCIKLRGKPAANSQVMRRSHIACQDAALSWVLGRKLKIDPAKEEFIDDNEANGLRVFRPARCR